MKLACLALVLSFQTATALEIEVNFDGAARIDGNSTWISLEGPITNGDAEKFKRFLASNMAFKRQMIALNSPGGNVEEAMKLGRIIRSHGLRTSVSGTTTLVTGYQKPIAGSCFSACFLVFAGGVERLKLEGSKIGFHQFYRPGLEDELVSLGSVNLELAGYLAAAGYSYAQLLSGEIVSYLISMGVDGQAWVLASKYSKDQMKIYTGDEEEEFRITWRPRKFLDWKIEPYKRGLVAYSKTQNGSSQSTIFCRNGDLKALLTLIGSGIDRDYYASLENRPNITVYFFDEPITRDRITIRTTDERLYIELDIPNKVYKSDVRTTLDLLGVDVGTMRDLHSFFDFNASGFSAALDLAKRNCIQ